MRASSAINNAILYTGRRYEPETGLYYYRARYYDVDAGRWHLRDPLGYVDGTGLYSYVKQTPLCKIDPKGLQVSLPAGLMEAVAQGWSAQALSQTFSITVEAAASLIAAYELAKAGDALVEQYKGRSKHIDPCDRAKDAVRQAQKSIDSLQKVVADHEQLIQDPSSYPGGLAPEFNDPVSIERLKTKWQGDIQRAKDNIEKNQNALTKLKKLEADACRCWYTW